MSSSDNDTDTSFQVVAQEPEQQLSPPKSQPGYLQQIRGHVIYLLLTPVRMLRPYIPNIVPFLILALFLPLVISLSTISGWMVWKNVATNWQEPVWLQYGYVPWFVYQICHHADIELANCRRPMRIYISQISCYRSLMIFRSHYNSPLRNPISLWATLWWN